MNMETFKHEDLGHSTYSNAAQIDEKDDIIQRLTMKVSKQALELQDLSSQLEVSRQLRSSTSPVNRSIGKYSRTDDEFDASGADGVDGLGTSKRDSSRTSYIFSSTAAQRRYEKEHHESMVAMQRQLDATEAKLADHIKARRKLIQDLDAKTRESKFLIKRCQELQSENEKMRVQMENALRLKENSVLALQEQSRGFHSSGQSIGLTAKQLTIRASDKIYQQQLMEEVKMHQELLQEAKKELSASKDREQQQRLKVKVLEDALEVRSEEIGLSGHSDLLAKLAKLRGEVTALKSELKAKRDRITDCEESHSNMQTTHQQMAQQVKTLQQRLAESQRETYRLQHGDVGEMLKVAEAERDRLLHFVQSDMEKSTKLARQVEQLEAELRTSKAKCELLEERSKANETEVENQRKRSKMIESKAQKESRLLSELQQNVDLVNKENDSLKQRLGQKTVEAEELNKVQMNLFMQVIHHRCCCLFTKDRVSFNATV